MGVIRGGDLGVVRKNSWAGRRDRQIDILMNFVVGDKINLHIVLWDCVLEVVGVSIDFVYLSINEV